MEQMEKSNFIEGGFFAVAENGCYFLFLNRIYFLTVNYYLMFYFKELHVCFNLKCWYTRSKRVKIFQ